jgi:hypothetical protein
MVWSPNYLKNVCAIFSFPGLILFILYNSVIANNLPDSPLQHCFSKGVIQFVKFPSKAQMYLTVQDIKPRSNFLKKKLV